MRKDKVVYIHRNPKTLEIYYVGMGNIYRAYNFFDRNRHWLNYTNKYGKPIVDIVASNLTEEDAWELEVLLIKEIGRKAKGEGTLTNISKGGCVSFAEGDLHGKSKRVIHLDIGEVFDTITSVMPYIDATHNHHVSSWLKEPRKKDLRIRLVDEDDKIVWIPKFDGIYDSGHKELTGVDLVCEDYDYEADYKEEELNSCLNLYRSKLDAQEKVVLELSILEGMSLSEISAKLEIGRSSVYRMLNDAKSYIRNNVSQDSNYVKKEEVVIPRAEKELIVIPPIRKHSQYLTISQLLKLV